MVDEQERSHFKYTGQLNLKVFILVFNNNKSEVSLLKSKGI